MYPYSAWRSAAIVFCSASRKLTFSRSFKPFTMPRISSTIWGASPMEGSSKRIIRGLAMRALPSAVICCSPPEVYPATLLRLASRIGK
jgi:hypothetical protein